MSDNIVTGSIIGHLMLSKSVTRNKIVVPRDIDCWFELEIKPDITLFGAYNLSVVRCFDNCCESE